MVGCLCFGGKSRGDKARKQLKAGKKPIFWVVGGPGTGKGTQCERLAEKYKLIHLSTGNLLRDEVSSRSELGQKVNEMMLTGQLVPLDIVLDLLTKAMMDKYDSGTGYLIDGYPREIIQGKEFQDKVGPCTQILYIECSDESMLKRLLGRSEGRADDNKDTIAKRIAVYHEVSEPVVMEYASITTRISGEQSPDEVFAECCQKIEPFLPFKA